MSTKIEWTEETWNPVTGCTKISAGCKNCYAERMARRLAGRFGYPEAPNHFDVTLRPDRLGQPSKWRKPRRVFVESMSDLFHPDVPGEFIWRVLDAATRGNRRHIYQILTKRPERMREWFVANQERFWHYKQTEYTAAPWPDPCLWLGATAENQKAADERIPYLLQTPAAVRFVSVEPMLSPIVLGKQCRKCGEYWKPSDLYYSEGDCPTENCGIDEDLISIDQVIIGCESGPGRRPMQLEWAVDLVEQCKAANVPVFVKQISVNGKVSHDPAEWPEELRVREYPTENARRGG